MDGTPLSPDQFAHRITQELQDSIAALAGNPQPTDILDIDSVDTFEILMVTEEMAGVLEPPENPPAIKSLCDLYRYYEALCVKGKGEEGKCEEGQGA